MAKNPWKKLSSKIVYKNPWFKIIEDKVIKPDGKPGTYSYMKTNGPSVYIVALNENSQFLIVGQYRYTSGKYSWEFPAGNSDGEDLLAAAKREFLEETGHSAHSWEMVGTFWAMNGPVNENCAVFIARELKKIGDDKQSFSANKMAEEGINKVRWVSFKELLHMINENRFTDGQSISALAKASLFLFNIDQYLA